MANIEKLRRELAFIKENPEKHNQSEWLRTDSADDPWCGTVGCFAGWTVVHEDGIESIRFRKEISLDMTCYALMLRSGKSIRDRSQEILELRDWEAEYLFGGSRTVEEIEDAIDRLEGGTFWEWLFGVRYSPDWQ